MKFQYLNFIKITTGDEYMPTVKKKKLNKNHSDESASKRIGYYSFFIYKCLYNLVASGKKRNYSKQISLNSKSILYL